MVDRIDGPACFSTLQAESSSGQSAKSARMATKFAKTVKQNCSLPCTLAENVDPGFCNLDGVP
jgi:hypothetical protein